MADGSSHASDNNSALQASNMVEPWWSAVGKAARLASDPLEWPALARRICSAGPRFFLLIAGFIYQNFTSFVVKLLWTSAGLVIIAIVVQALTQRVTIIEPLSVPKALADRGYSPDVAAQRFRDAMTHFAASVDTSMKKAEVALHAELPNIVVPTVGISLNAVMVSLRTLFHGARAQSIGGEFIIVHDQLWLRLRLNGSEFYSSKIGGDPEKPDELLAIAVPEAMKKIQPYFLAASLKEKDADGALDLIRWIIANLPEQDENVAWAYNLRGSIEFDRSDYSAAEASLQQALALNSKLAASHLNLGRIREQQGNLEEAVAECQRAIKLAPNYAAAYNNVGNYLVRKGSTEEGIRELRKAIRLAPNEPLFHANLGVALRHKPDELENAIGEFEEALRLNPKDPAVRVQFGFALIQIGRDEQAMREYQEAIKLRPNYALAHYNLAVVLESRGDVAKAVAEYQEAIRHDPGNAQYHDGLRSSWRKLGNADEGIK